MASAHGAVEHCIREVQSARRGGRSPTTEQGRPSPAARAFAISHPISRWHFDAHVPSASPGLSLRRSRSPICPARLLRSAHTGMERNSPAGYLADDASRFAPGWPGCRRQDCRLRARAGRAATSLGPVVADSRNHCARADRRHVGPRHLSVHHRRADDASRRCGNNCRRKAP